MEIIFEGFYGTCGYINDNLSGSRVVKKKYCESCKGDLESPFGKFNVCVTCFKDTTKILTWTNVSKKFGLTKDDIKKHNIWYDSFQSKHKRGGEYQQCFIYKTPEILQLADKLTKSFEDKKGKKKREKYLKQKAVFDQTIKNKKDKSDKRKRIVKNVKISMDKYEFNIDFESEEVNSIIDCRLIDDKILESEIVNILVSDLDKYIKMYKRREEITKLIIENIPEEYHTIEPSYNYYNYKNSHKYNQIMDNYNQIMGNYRKNRKHKLCFVSEEYKIYVEKGDNMSIDDVYNKIYSDYKKIEDEDKRKEEILDKLKDLKSKDFNMNISKRINKGKLKPIYDNYWQNNKGELKNVCDTLRELYHLENRLRKEWNELLLLLRTEVGIYGSDIDKPTKDLFFENKLSKDQVIDMMTKKYPLRYREKKVRNYLNGIGESQYIGSNIITDYVKYGNVDFNEFKPLLDNFNNMTEKRKNETRAYCVQQDVFPHWNILNYGIIKKYWIGDKEVTFKMVKDKIDKLNQKFLRAEMINDYTRSVNLKYNTISLHTTKFMSPVIIKFLNNEPNITFDMVKKVIDDHKQKKIRKKKAIDYLESLNLDIMIIGSCNRIFKNPLIEKFLNGEPNITFNMVENVLDNYKQQGIRIKMINKYLKSVGLRYNTISSSTTRFINPLIGKFLDIEPNITFDMVEKVIDDYKQKIKMINKYLKSVNLEHMKIKSHYIKFKNPLIRKFLYGEPNITFDMVKKSINDYKHKL